jgi:hypothetical protein
MMPDPQNDISSPEEERAMAEQEAVAKRAQARAAGRLEVETEVVPSRRSNEQAIFLARIRRTREAGMLPSLEEIDILIGIVEELTK